MKYTLHAKFHARGIPVQDETHTSNNFRRLVLRAVWMSKSYPHGVYKIYDEHGVWVEVPTALHLTGLGEIQARAPLHSDGPPPDLPQAARYREGTLEQLGVWTYARYPKPPNMRVYDTHDIDLVNDARPPRGGIAKILGSG